MRGRGRRVKKRKGFRRLRVKSKDRSKGVRSKGVGDVDVEFQRARSSRRRATHLGSSFDVLGMGGPETRLARATRVLGVVGRRGHGCDTRCFSFEVVVSLLLKGVSRRFNQGIDILRGMQKGGEGDGCKVTMSSKY
jgi:hypothetical protein